ncbi:unnamed protein product [Polarella glacialis]|uniref:RRM domain-containing protein n=1 Tax=Polarella glacialis TaxID=89957 RepID=A0A813FAA3_POLGL|nr:unnamed protein product [Polarella glacialis]
MPRRMLGRTLGPIYGCAVLVLGAQTVEPEERHCRTELAQRAATFWDAILADDSLPQSHRDKALEQRQADLAGDGLGAERRCCALASKRLCSERLGQCRDDDYPIGKTVCWPPSASGSAAHFLGACCPEYRRKLLSARAPSWMMREVTEDFAIWKGSWQPQISSERLDDAERRFGEHLCRFTVRAGVLQLGTTLACREHSHGPFVIKDIAAGVETLLGAGALSSDVDFLVMWDDSNTDLPRDLPVFAHGMARCQKGVALIPLNDCLGGLADELHRRILDGMEATPSPDSNQWTRDALDNRLVWRGSIRSSVTCTPPNTKPEACRCEQLDHPDNTSDLKRWARFRLLDQAHRFPDDLDARGRCASCRPGAEAPSWFASLPQQGDSHGFAWRNYLLHGSVDANAYNTLANWRPLLLGRVLVKQVAAITVSWFRHGLKPFVHYIPVREDLSDLRKQLAWARAHPNETESIRRAGFEFARKYVAKKTESKEEESAIPPREHVERAKKKLQERRDEEMWDKAGDKIRALTLGTPNKCKAPVVTSQRFSDRLEQCWIDIEWLCKCASATTERIEYELRVQAIDKGAEEWAEVYHGWESSVAGLGPFPVGSYEFMVRARNSIGWGEWSDVVVISLDDPKWERQQKKEAEQQVLEKQARSLQAELQSILDEFQEMQGENKLTIHRASNLLFHLQAESKRGRMLRAYLPDQQLLRRADSAVQLLERWRDRKEAFAEWKQSLSEMRSQLLQEQLLQADALDLEHFLGQDEHYFGSLSPAIRNLIVQTLLGLDAKQVFKKLTTVQKERITSILRRGGDLGRAVMPSPPEDDAKKASGGSSSSTSCASKSQTIFTKHQIDQLLKLAELFSVAQARMVPRSFRSTGYPCGDSGGSEEAPPAAPLAPSASGGSRGGSDFGGSEEVVVSLAPQTAPVSEPAVASNARAVPSISDDRDKNLGTQQDKSRIVSRTVHVTGLPCGKTSNVTRGDLVSALRPFAEVDGARVGTLDALVRFSTPEQAQKALSALERGVVSLRRSILSGTAAPADLLSEEALLRAGGRAPPEKRPPAPAAAAAAAATAAATATAAVAAQKAR